MFNSKGQAFSVFQLLIAAVVALAILGLLMSIMGMIDFSPKNKPMDVAKTALRDAQNNLYTPYVEEVVFNKKSNIINSAAVIEVLNTTSLKLSCHSDLAGSGFACEENFIRYEGSQDKKVNMLALCGTNATTSESAVSDMEIGVGIAGEDEFACYLVVYPFTG